MLELWAIQNLDPYCLLLNPPEAWRLWRSCRWYRFARPDLLLSPPRYALVYSELLYPLSVPVRGFILLAVSSSICFGMLTLLSPFTPPSFVVFSFISALCRLDACRAVITCIKHCIDARTSLVSLQISDILTCPHFQSR